MRNKKLKKHGWAFGVGLAVLTLALITTHALSLQAKQSDQSASIFCALLGTCDYVRLVTSGSTDGTLTWNKGIKQQVFWESSVKGLVDIVLLNSAGDTAMEIRKKVANDDHTSAFTPTVEPGLYTLQITLKNQRKLI